MNSIAQSERRAREYNLFWRVMGEGLEGPEYRTVEDFQGEMATLAMYAIDSALREAAAKAMTRYDQNGEAAGRDVRPLAVRRIAAANRQ